MSPEDVDKMLKQVLLKDLRIQCRARGLSPAGGKEQVRAFFLYFARGAGFFLSCLQ
jgi:hypothetical protein